jgi:hypothetical protein
MTYQDTSHESYLAIVGSNLLSDLQRAVVTFFYAHQNDMARHQLVAEFDIAEHFGGDSTRTYRTRIAELLAMQVIEHAGYKINPKTDKKQRGYRLTGSMPIPYTNPRLSASAALHAAAQLVRDGWWTVLAAHADLAHAMETRLKSDFDAVVRLWATVQAENHVA